MEPNKLNEDRNQATGSGGQLPGQHGHSDVEAGRNHILVKEQMNRNEEIMGESDKFRPLSKVQIVKGGETVICRGKQYLAEKALLLAIDEQRKEVEGKVGRHWSQDTYKDRD